MHSALSPSFHYGETLNDGVDSDRHPISPCTNQWEQLTDEDKHLLTPNTCLHVCVYTCAC